MKPKFLTAFILVLSVFPTILYSQISEDFSDGDFINNPTWTGSESLFIVENGVLRSNSTSADNFYLSTPNADMDDTEWRFYLNLDFATSGANYVEVYLVADNQDLSAVQNGYFLKFGGTPDEISLYKISSGDISLLIDGEDGVIGSSSNNIFEVKVQRTASGEWSIAYDEGQTGNFVSAGIITDSEVATTSTFGFRIEQSTAASAVNSHYFDNILVGPIPVDLTPPEITSAVALSDSEIKLTFSEPLDETSAENISNYDISGVFSSVLTAQLSSGDPTIVNLILDNPVPNGSDIVLSVMNVEDLAGNPMAVQTVEIFYFASDYAGYKDVVFNEIMADPSPVQGLPDAEFIEIFNASTSAIFDMQNWTLVNTTTAKTLESAVLQPGQFLILCNTTDTALFSGFGNVLGIPSFSAISNTGDSLTLLNPEGEIIDLVSFNDSWYNDPGKKDGGFTLELMNPFTACSGKSNWSGSNNSNGGTPGAQNSIFDESPDLESPTIISTSVVSPQLVHVNFSEVMDLTSLQNGSYQWSEGITTTSISSSPNLMSVDLSLDNPLETGIEYTLTVSGVSDCPGNMIAENTTVTILLGLQPEQYDLLITEILADPTPSVGLPEGEYFELYNASNKVLDLNGVRLNDVVFSNSKILFPGDYLICIDESNIIGFLNYPNAYILPDLGSTYFTNSGRDLTLYNANNEQIDQVNYRIEWYRDSKKSDGGYSLERINLSEPCRGGDNWIASIDPEGGTPQAVNSVNSTVPDEQPPILQTVFVQDSTHLELIFSEPIDSVSIFTTEISIVPEIGILSVDNVSPYYTSIQIELSEPLTQQVIYSIIVFGVTDCVGNEIVEPQSLPFGLPQKGLPGDILLNEILFNPRTGGSDFVEIVNVSDKIVGLQNWALQNQDLTTQTISTDPLVIYPGAYRVFTSDPGNIAQEYPFGKPENFVKMQSLPSYNNSSGAVIIVDAEENLIDRFDYSEDFQFSLLNTFKGVSLERTSFTRPTNDSGNWTSAAESEDFGTPGKINSQYNSEGTASTDFEFENELFSPDNDGFQDLLNLNYKLEAPGYVATIKIFDIRGRLVRNLIENELLATEGTITWDGVRDNGTKARIGPHLMFISIFDLDGNTQTIKLPLIVAGKLSN